MPDSVVLIYDTPKMREACIKALHLIDCPYREVSSDSILLLTPKVPEVVVWGISDLTMQARAALTRFVEHHSSHPVVLFVPDSISKESIDSPPDDTGLWIFLPADEKSLNDLIRQAFLLKNTEADIRLIRDKIRHVETEFDVFLRVGRAIASSLELNQVLTSIMNITGKLLESEAWSLGLIDHDTGELVFEAALGARGEMIRGLRIPKGKGVIGWVAEHGEPLIVADTSKDLRHLKEVDRNVGFESRSILCLPLKTRGKTVGAIEFINKLGRGQFTPEDIDRVRVFVDLAAVSIENALLYRHVAHLSERDELSGLYNQRTLLKILASKIEESRQTHSPLAYIFLDLDRFKSVNDRYGHLMGRETLREVGQVLLNAAKDDTILGRYGGDEFCVILPGYTRVKAREKAERIRSAIAAHTFLLKHGLSIKLTASIGLALFPEHASSFDELTRIADQAMSAAKRKQRNTVVLADQQQML